MDEFRAFIERYILLTDAEWAHVAQVCRPATVGKGRLVLQAGQVCQDYFFVVRGACGIFQRSAGQEVTGWLAFENDFFTELRSFRSQTPSRFTIQALEDTELLRIAAADLPTLYRSVAGWSQLVREVWEEAFLKTVDALLDYQTATAEQRYAKLQQRPQLLERVPQKYLSSFLGVTPTSLSRLRRRKPRR